MFDEVRADKIGLVDLNENLCYSKMLLLLCGNQGYLAYTILGIPSIIFGLLLIKEKKYSGFFLFLNGVLCILGIVGHMINNRLLELGIVAGGIIYFSVVFMAIEFKDIE